VNTGPVEIVFVAVTVGIAGSAAGSEVSGNSVASPHLKSDTAKMVSTYATAAAKCDRIDSIDVQTLKVDSNVKGNAAGHVTQGNIDERWTAKLCGQQIPFLVTFIPDGKGGTYMRIRPDTGK
jgi:hypothetical protein